MLSLDAVFEDVLQSIQELPKRFQPTCFLLKSYILPFDISIHSSSTTKKQLLSSCVTRSATVMRLSALTAAALLGTGPWVFGRPQATSPDLNQLQSLYNSIVAVNPISTVRSSPSIPDVQVDSSSIISTGSSIDASLLTPSIGSDPIGLNSPTGLLTAFKTPAGPLEIDQVANDQPTNYQLTIGDSNTLPAPSDGIDSPVEVPSVSDAPLYVSPAVKTSFQGLKASKYLFGIYGVSADKIEFQIKQCGNSQNPTYFAEKITTFQPCLAVWITTQNKKMISILYYEAGSDDVNLLLNARGDFEADLHATTHYQIERKDAHDVATLRKILRLRG